MSGGGRGAATAEAGGFRNSCCQFGRNPYNFFSKERRVTWKAGNRGREMFRSPGWRSQRGHGRVLLPSGERMRVATRNRTGRLPRLVPGLGLTLGALLIGSLAFTVFLTVGSHRHAGGQQAPPIPPMPGPT